MTTAQKKVAMRVLKKRNATARRTMCFGRVATSIILVCGCTQQLRAESVNQTEVSARVETEAPRLVLLYIPCTVNRAYLSPYNESVSYTPAIDAFARDSVVFERHQTEAGQSGIAYASIFSGTHANRHGVYSHPKAMEDSLYVITEAFRDAGYDIWFWSGQGMATAALKGQGGKVIKHPFLSASGIEADSKFDRLLLRLKSDPEYRAFVVTAFTQTHAPYQWEPLQRFCTDFPAECEEIAALTPSETKSLYAFYKNNQKQLTRNFPETPKRLGLHGKRLQRLAALLDTLYKANVYALDTRFSKLIEKLKEVDLYDKSMIAFTADHGESTFRKGTLFPWTHGYALNPEVIQVPWMLHAPSLGVISGRHEGVTRSIDVYPTMAALASVDILINDAIDGVDLSLSLKGEQPPPSLFAYSHTSVHPLLPEYTRQSEAWTLFHSLYPRRDRALIWVMVRKDDLVVKMRNVGSEEFRFAAYDLAKDPYETDDIYNEDVPLHSELRKRIEIYKRTLLEGATSRSAQGESLSIDERSELLKSLGYID